jgi:hypothetical protein
MGVGTKTRDIFPKIACVYKKLIKKRKKWL